jgi:acyl-CoA synthetase (NDP forming)/RimJ/RimL family protein N-acetyltransferase
MTTAAMSDDPTAAVETGPYPAHWEADILLSDGATAHIRPITPDDAEMLVAFYARVSEESKYYRFFAPRPTLSERDVRNYTTVDHDGRVAFIVTVGGDMIGVGRYDRIGASGHSAEVAFLVEDAHHGRGLGSVLLEHLAQAARERGVRQFIADVLPANRKMIKVFTDAGYTVQPTYEDGVLHVEFDIDPTDESLAVLAAREQRAEARSISRLLRPDSVAVVGASRQRDKIGQALVRNLVSGGYTGPVYAVNPEAPAIAGVPAFPTLDAVPAHVDVAILAVPADTVLDVVDSAAGKGVRGLVVVSAGFADAGPEGRRRQQQLTEHARANGMRVLGPNCLGMINTDPAYSLNASVSQVMPGRGRIGFFSQSGAFGQSILAQCVDRGLGLSTFISAGNRADVSGNDLLQYWDEDPATDVVLLYLESIGNPRKFGRIARRLSRSKPVLAVKTGMSTQGVPLGRDSSSVVPPSAVDALFRQSGVVRVDTLNEMFDVASLLAYQPMPRGPRVAVVGNSDALGLLTADAATSAGLQVVGRPIDLGTEAGADEFDPALRMLAEDDDVDSIVVVYAPRLESRAPEVAGVLASVAAGTDKPVITTFLGSRGIPEPLRVEDESGVLQPGSVPSFPSPEEAVRALARVVEYAAWRERPVGVVRHLEDVDEAVARMIAANVLRDTPAGRELTVDELTDLLAAYGIELYPMLSAPTVEQAVAAGERLGWNVALKARASHLQHRADLADVWRNIDSEQEMRDAWTALTSAFASAEDAEYIVQPMAASGVPVALRAVEDPGYGPVLSFGVGGVATEVIGDRSYRIPPLTDVDAVEMVREVKAAPLLLGFGGSEPADLSAVEDLLHRLSALTDDVPEVVDLELSPVLVRTDGLAVVNAAGRVAPAASRADWYTRRLG